MAAAGLAVLLAFSIATFVAPASTQADPSGLFPDSINPADVAYTLVTTAMQLLLIPATAFFYGGLGCHKNILSTLLQCMMSLIVIAPLFAFIG